MELTMAEALPAPTSRRNSLRASSLPKMAWLTAFSTAPSSEFSALWGLVAEFSPSDSCCFSVTGDCSPELLILSHRDISGTSSGDSNQAVRLYCLPPPSGAQKRLFYAPLPRPPVGASNANIMPRHCSDVIQLICVGRLMSSKQLETSPELN